MQAIAYQRHVARHSALRPDRAAFATQPPPQAQAQEAKLLIKKDDSLQPQISLEASKLQQLGASMGTKLRPESAQKIQV